MLCPQPITKAIWRRKKIYVNAFDTLFQKDEAHLSKAEFFDELAEKGEVIAARPELYHSQSGRLMADNAEFT